MLNLSFQRIVRQKYWKSGLGAQEKGPGWRYNVTTIGMEVATEIMGVDNVAQGESRMGREEGLYQSLEEHLKGRERKRSPSII